MSKMPALLTSAPSGRPSARFSQAAAKARTLSNDDRSSAATSSDGAGAPAAAASARNDAASSSPRPVERHASTTARASERFATRAACATQDAPCAPLRASAAAISVPMPLRARYGAKRRVYGVRRGERSERPPRHALRGGAGAPGAAAGRAWWAPSR